MLTRKRKRSQASPAPEHDPDAATSDAAPEHEALSAEERLQKEAEIWDAFREEHHEAIEQLPLTLHRQYSLLSELDHNVALNQRTLLLTLSSYVSKRKEAAASGSVVQNNDALLNGLPIKPATSDKHSSLSPTTANPQPADDNGPEKGLLQSLRQVALSTDDIIRSSEEKVNIARAAHEFVERHVRMLQMAINELEAAMIQGSGPPYLRPALPDLVALRGNRPTRPTLEEEEEEEEESAHLPIGAEHKVTDNVPGGDKGKTKSRKSGRSRQDSSLTITLPPTAVDTDDRTYCYCERESFGEMIACDSKKCEREWFHLECVGLDVSPEDGVSWYCRDCRPAQRSRKRK